MNRYSVERLYCVRSAQPQWTSDLNIGGWLREATALMNTTLTGEHLATIREATSFDAERLGQFGSRLVALHHELDPHRFLDTTSTTSKSYARFLETKISQAAHILLVAEVNSTIVGYVYAAIEGPDYMSLRGPAGVVHDLFVDTSHRTQGIGRTLMNAVLLEFAKRGSPRVVLSTASRNETAQRLFASMGFRPAMLEMTQELQVGEQDVNSHQGSL